MGRRLHAIPTAVSQLAPTQNASERSLGEGSQKFATPAPDPLLPWGSGSGAGVADAGESLLRT